MNRNTDTTAPAGAPEQTRSIYEALQDFDRRLGEVHAIVDLTWEISREGFDYNYAGDIATISARRANQFCSVLSMSEGLLSDLATSLEPIIRAAGTANRAGGL